MCRSIIISNSMTTTIHTSIMVGHHGISPIMLLMLIRMHMTIDPIILMLPSMMMHEVRPIMCQIMIIILNNIIIIMILIMIMHGSMWMLLIGTIMRMPVMSAKKWS